MSKLNEMSPKRFEVDIVQAFLIGVMSTCTVFYYSLAQHGSYSASFAGSEILFGFMMPAENWFWFSLGVTICLGAVAIQKTSNYVELVNQHD